MKKPLLHSIVKIIYRLIIYQLSWTIKYSYIAVKQRDNDRFLYKYSVKNIEVTEPIFQSSAVLFHTERENANPVSLDLVYRGAEDGNAVAREFP